MANQGSDIKPIDFYSWTTPNGRKVELILEELNLPYNYHAINIGTGDQFKPEFLKISPNNKIPAIVDSNTKSGTPLSIFESGAILIYLAKKYQARANINLLPDEESDPQGHSNVLQWLFWQVGGLGPMLGQLGHFRSQPEKIEYAINRYATEAKRLFGVLDKQLESTGAFIAGPNYSIADIAAWFWSLALPRFGEEFVNAYPHVTAWIERVKQRPAAAKVFAKM
jgi:GST-like protein